MAAVPLSVLARDKCKKADARRGLAERGGAELVGARLCGVDQGVVVMGGL